MRQPIRGATGRLQASGSAATDDPGEPGEPEREISRSGGSGDVGTPDAPCALPVCAPAGPEPMPPMTATAGITARVLHGSLWNVGGQFLTLGAAFLATPIVIRQLGTQGYGVLTLVNLLVGYLAFADLGMGEASTRFAAAAHEKGADEESAVVWTSLLVALVPTILAALALTFGAPMLVRSVFALPRAVWPAATSALRVAGLGFAGRALAGVLNTPQLVRLRLDLCSIINSSGGTLQVVLVPAVIAAGGGLTGAVWVISGTAVGTALAHAAAGLHFLPQLARPRLQRKLVRPLARFGGAIALTALVNIALAQGEKLMLARFGSVSALAHYSVATTLVSLLGIAPIAIGQAMMPAFARLSSWSEREPLQRLYSRMLQANLLWIVPAVLVLCVSARPFFTLWAGPEFGRHSAGPSYVLAIGLLLNVITFVPYRLLIAAGRASFVARYHLLELVPYLCLAALLTRWFGAVGAAAACSARLAVPVLVMLRAARRFEGLNAAILPDNRREYLLAVAILLVPAGITAAAGAAPLALIGVTLASVTAYALWVWHRVLTAYERSTVRRLLTLRTLARTAS